MTYPRIQWLVLVPLLASCGAATPGAQPEDMSAREHREHADVHQEHADQEQAQYDPDARRERGREYHSNEFVYTRERYNPTERHSDLAAEHRQHVQDHLAAAQALESFENDQCGSFPPETRSSCPLLGQLSSVRDVDRGVQIEFLSDVDFDAVEAHVQCHLAYARARNFEGMAHCPLYLRGASATRAQAARSLTLTTSDASGVARVRAQARAHLTSNQPASP